MSGLFDQPTPPQRPQRPAGPPASPRRQRVMLMTFGIVITAFFFLSTFTGIWTDRLWFRSVGFGGVYSTMLWTRVGLFVAFGLLMALIVGTNMYLAFRFRPAFRLVAPDASLERYREAIDPIRKWAVVSVSALLGLIAGGSAASEWRTYLQWSNGTSFGEKDAYFNKDIGFFVFDLPWLHFVANFLMTVLVIGLLVAAVTHYLFGGIALQARGERVTPAAQVHFSVLLGLFVLVKAWDYWLDRFDLTTEQGRRFTGINFTADNAILPSKNILIIIAIICAVLFFANIIMRSWLLPGIGLGLLVLSAVLLGALWPGVVYQFQVRPSEPDKEEPYLARNIEATRSAFGIETVDEQPYNATLNVTEQQVAASAESLPGIRLIDPARTSQAFEQLQQVRGYYSVADILDVDRYKINGQDRDVVLGVRELDQAGLTSSQRNWANEHTVYTHGFGVVAAFGNNQNADGSSPVNDEPPWAEEDLPPRGELSDIGEGYEPRIYFGEKSPEYSIVGKPEGAANVELDIPEEGDGDRGTTTYSGADGVDVGNVFQKMLYAIKFSEPNILLSSRVNENSKVIYERNPRDRVQKVAPWLTVDADPYPAVVDGRVVWVMDGYTATDRYPNAERESFETMTSDALSQNPTFVTLPTDQINYMRNSVKAVVDAYDGTVTLYEWESDPILETWKKVFPGVVTDAEDISDDLRSHLRYPEDLFKVQRYILAQYHVTDAPTFYRGTDQWEVPEDPASTANLQPPYRLSVQMPQPPEGSDLTAPSEDPVFSLTSVYTPANRSNLASFISVNSDATSEDYGTIRILRLPDSTQVPGPSQIANTLSADQEIQQQLLPIKDRTRFGNLLTLPIGGGLLYVQPVYALRDAGQGAYPVLQFVLTSFGDEAGYGRTLTEAIESVLGGDGGTLDPLTPAEPTDPTDPADPPAEPSQPAEPDSVIALLQQADEKFAAADVALRAGNLQRYAKLTSQAEALVQRALTAAQQDAAAGGTATTKNTALLAKYGIESTKG